MVIGRVLLLGNGDGNSRPTPRKPDSPLALVRDAENAIFGSSGSLSDCEPGESVTPTLGGMQRAFEREQTILSENCFERISHEN